MREAARVHRQDHGHRKPGVRVAARGECPRRVGRQRCLELEGKLAQLKPLKRQFEEYRVQVTDAEAALAD